MTTVSAPLHRLRSPNIVVVPFISVGVSTYKVPEHPDILDTVSVVVTAVVPVLADVAPVQFWSVLTQHKFKLPHMSTLLLIDSVPVHAEILLT